MKKNIHPDYGYVVFRDVSCGKTFRIRSTCKPKEAIVWDDGKTYPLMNLDVSSESHPVYTGKQQVTQAEGRVAKFKQRYNKD